MKKTKLLVVLLAVVALLVTITVLGITASAADVTIDRLTGRKSILSDTTKTAWATQWATNQGSNTIKLTTDLDLSQDSSAQVTMPGTFTGTFDGQGYTIKGITTPLFNELGSGAVVKNVTLEGNISGNARNLASVTYKAVGATLQGVTSKVNITITGDQGDLNAGGLVGYSNGGGGFIDCTYAGTYTVATQGGNAIGGFVGYANNNGNPAEYTNCSFTGNIVINGSYSNRLKLGGFIGYAYNGATTITNANITGTFTLNKARDTDYVGGVAGEINSDVSSINNSFVNITVNKGNDVYVPVSPFMAAGSAKVNGCGNLTDGKYHVSDAAGLMNYYAPDRHIVLLNDITLPENTQTFMGLSGEEFTGTFDGNGYAISGISNTLFDTVKGGTVKNLTLNGKIDYSEEEGRVELRRTASLAANATYQAKFENIVSNVDITTKATNDLNLGGVVGYPQDAHFKNVTYTGNFVAELGTGAKGGAFGGIVGYSNNNKNSNTAVNTYENCVFSGTLTLNGNVNTGAIRVGGIGGNLKGKGHTLTNCVSTGTININSTTTGGYYVAGIVGRFEDSPPNTVTGGISTATINFAEGINATAADFINGNGTATDVVAAERFGTYTTEQDDKGNFEISAEKFAAFISSRASEVGGKSDLRFIIVAGYNYLCENDDAVITVKIGGKTFTKNIVDELYVYQSATAAGEKYIAADGSVIFGFVLTDVPNDVWGDLSVSISSEKTETTVGGYVTQEVAVAGRALGAAVPGGMGNWGIEDWHSSTKYTASAILYFNNRETVIEMTSKSYIVKFLYNGELYRSMLVNYDGNFVRASLEYAGMTGITPGKTFDMEVQIFAPNGDIVYYSGMQKFTVADDVYSTDMGPTVDLPTSGIKELEVNKESLGWSGLNNVWNESSENVAQLFDGNYMDSKIGGNVVENKDEDGNVISRNDFEVTFSLVEPATISYYTFFTGNDTNSNPTRNPDAWTLYAKDASGNWVAISEVGYDSHTGLWGRWSTPASYATVGAFEAQDYKVVFTPAGGQFQMNELKVYANDASVTNPTVASLIGDAFVHRLHSKGYDADVARIRTGVKTDYLAPFPNIPGTSTSSISEITEEGAYAYVKDPTTGVFTRYEITEITTNRWCDINFILDGFVPEAGVTYEMVCFFYTGDNALVPNALHALPMNYSR